MPEEKGSTEYSGGGDEQSTDKHEVKSSRGTAGKHRDGRITSKVWKSGKLNVSQLLQPQSRAAGQPGPGAGVPTHN